jgi:hypothetical protein
MVVWVRCGVGRVCGGKGWEVVDFPEFLEGFLTGLPGVFLGKYLPREDGFKSEASWRHLPVVFS